MSKFPKRYCLPDGSIYQVTLENVRADWAFTVDQFDDLSENEKKVRVEDFDEDQAETWMSEQWYGAEIVTWGAYTGEIDLEVREEALEDLKRSQDNSWASEMEVKQ